jgi:hypothetical protein
MDLSGLKHYIKRFREPAKKQKMYVFLLCLFCSAVFWLFIKLSRENQAVFRQPLSVIDMPPGSVLYDQSDTVISYSLQSTGARLIASRYFSTPDTLRLNAGTLPRLSRLGVSYHFVTSTMMTQLLSDEIDGNFAVLSVRPDTVFFQVVEAMEKMVPVHLHADLSYERRFGKYGEIAVDPDSVLITGPSSIIDTVDHVHAEALKYERLNQPVHTKAGILPFSNHQAVRVIPGTVQVHIQVEEYTEAHVEVPLEVLCNDSLYQYPADRLRLFPGRVNLVLLVALRDFHLIDAALFSAYVVCPGINDSETQLEVRTEHLPDFVRLESIRPARVDYLIMN